jgi:hypothetical protein
MGDFLAFRKFMTPVFIQIIFWIGVAGIVIFGFVSLIAGLTSPGQALGGVLGFFIGMPIGLVLWRVYCEILMVFFRMLSRLESIDSKTR